MNMRQHFLKLNHSKCSQGLPGGTVVKNPPVIQKVQVQFLVWEDPLEKEMATHFSSLAWITLWTEKSDVLQSMGSQKSWA